MGKKMGEPTTGTVTGGARPQAALTDVSDLDGVVMTECKPIEDLPTTRVSDIKGLVVVPTYNEADNITRLMEMILALPCYLEILVVDDNSPDGTAAIVEAEMGRDRRIHLHKRPGKMGLGSAYVEGFKYALAKTDMDVVFQMDADFSHDPRSIPRFLEAIEEHDLILGSRYLNGVTVVNWPLQRLVLSYGANLYSRLITGLPFNDATGGYKCFRREVLETIDLDRIRADGYSFQIETTYMAWQKRFRIREIPIIFADRRVGISKMNRRIVWEAIFMVWRLAVTHLTGRRPAERDSVKLVRRSRENR
jgi:dolichol-phosphate mannosyltransferase